MKINDREATEALERGFEIIVPPDGVQEKIELARKEQRPLRVKLGFDPTSPDLHLGHSVVLRKLAEFQAAGHTVVVIVGDFTARIGDPTGKNKTRPPLSKEEVEVNAETYLSQVGIILKDDCLEVRHNSEWIASMGMGEVVKLAANITVGQLLQRHDFKERYLAGVPIGLHELFYPLLQAIDSVKIQADIEIGGTDQLFNCMMGRDLQMALAQPAQVVACMPLLVGTDGKEKMSKSLGNDIPISATADAMFGKLMSVPDELVHDYNSYLCEGVEDNRSSAMERKLRMAQSVTARFHGEEGASSAREMFRVRFQDRGESDDAYQPIAIPREMQQASIFELTKFLVPEFSGGEARRLISEGGVRVDRESIRDPKALIRIDASQKRIRIGRTRFFALSLEE